MPNWCYTTYHFDGPTEEIQLLFRNVRKSMKFAIFSQKREDKIRGSEPVYRNYPSPRFDFVWLRDNEFLYHLSFLLRILHVPFPHYRWIWSSIATKRIPVHIVPLENGRSRLILETKSAWSSDHGVWLFAAATWAPNTEVFYYEEELFGGCCETNDLLREHFPKDYTVCADLPKGSSDMLLQSFGKPEWLRMREDQYQVHYSYWSQQELRNELLKFIPKPRLFMRELIDKFMEKKYPADKGRHSSFFIKKIVRRPSPWLEKK